MARILIVEDDRITAWALQRVVTRMGHTVVARIFSAAEAMAVVQADRPNVVLLDIGLTGPQDGLLVGLDIQTLWSTPVIYLSGSDPPSSACLIGLTPYGAIWPNRSTGISSRTSWHSSSPPLGGEDMPHPRHRSRLAWTTPKLREQLRHLRQPVGAF
jgi:CheY-like chemotaxis protein